MLDLVKPHFSAAVFDSFSKYHPFLEDIFARYGITTPLRQAHFLAQIAHESGGFCSTRENLNYSAQGLSGVFKKYFPTPEKAQAFARQPEKIANLVYANRLGNGPVESGDGFKYRGRGLVQLTGKSNYAEYSADSHHDFINSPDELMDPRWSIDVAGWFWAKRGLNACADQDDVVTITKKINGGTNGLDSRIKYLSVFKAALGIAAPHK